jgi:ankyrin repeat protein
MGVVGAFLVAALVGAVPAESPVADAARSGDLETVRSLLRDGADVNAAQGDGMSALHWAAERGDAPMIEVLVRAGAEVQSATRIGEYTPLHLAARNGHPAAVQALIAAGADVMRVTNPSGSSPLHLGALSGSRGVIEALIAAGADPNATEAEWSQTPLIFAAAWNRVDAIHALVEGGADPDIAAESMDLTVMGRLDSEADRRRQAVLDAFTNEGEWDPTSAQLQAAVQAGRAAYEAEAPAERRRSSRFQRQVRIANKGGLTPLLHAARQGHLESMTALLDQGGDIDLPGGGDGTTPLLIAAINGQFDAAALLLERGADPNLASAVNGVTPLFATVNSEWQPRTRYPQPQEREAQSLGYLQVIEALLVAGADPNERLTLHPWYPGHHDQGASATEPAHAGTAAACLPDRPSRGGGLLRCPGGLRESVGRGSDLGGSSGFNQG